MKIDNSYLSVVLVGSFNTQILRDPSWIKKYLFPDSTQQNFELKINLEMPSEDITSSVEIEDIKIEIKKGKISIAPKSFSLEYFKRIYNIIDNISKNIPHTPMVAYGINFVFSGDSNKSVLWNKKNIVFHDYENQKTEMELKQVYSCDNCTINFTISEKKISAKKYFENFIFNFNVPVTTNAKEALTELIKNKKIDVFLDIANKFINSFLSKPEIKA